MPALIYSKWWISLIMLLFPWWHKQKQLSSLLQNFNTHWSMFSAPRHLGLCLHSWFLLYCIFWVRPAIPWPIPTMHRLWTSVEMREKACFYLSLPNFSSWKHCPQTFHTTPACAKGPPHLLSIPRTPICMKMEKQDQFSPVISRGSQQ